MSFLLQITSMTLLHRYFTELSIGSCYAFVNLLTHGSRISFSNERHQNTNLKYMNKQKRLVLFL